MITRMKAIGAALVIAGVAATAPSANAQVGRPDLPDVAGASFSDLGNANGNISLARGGSLYVAGTGAGSHTFYGDIVGLSVIDPVTDEAAVFVAAIDVPDRVKRKINRQVVNQKAFLPFVSLAVQTEGGFATFGSAFGTLAGCKARFRLEGFNAGRFRYETVDLKGACDQAGLESLIAFPSARDVAQRLLGTKSDGSGIRFDRNDVANSVP